MLMAYVDDLIITFRNVQALWEWQENAQRKKLWKNFNLVINSKKSEVLLVGQNRNLMVQAVKEFKVVDEIKYLGLNVSAFPKL